MPLPPLPTRLGSTLSAEEINAAKRATPPVAKPQKTIPAPPVASSTVAPPSSATPSSKRRSKAPTETPAATKPPIAPPVQARAQKNKQADQQTARPSPKARASKSPRRQTEAGISKLFVLDTNVLLHDSNSLFKFEEHDIYLPMMVLEELDHQKKGMSEVARNARQVSRNLDGIVANHSLEGGLALNSLGNTEARGLVFSRLKRYALPCQLICP